MELLQNGLRPHSGVTLFVSVDFSEICLTSVIAALPLTLGVNGPLDSNSLKASRPEIIREKEQFYFGVL